MEIAMSPDDDHHHHSRTALLIDLTENHLGK